MTVENVIFYCIYQIFGLVLCVEFHVCKILHFMDGIFWIVISESGGKHRYMYFCSNYRSPFLSSWRRLLIFQIYSRYFINDMWYNGTKTSKMCVCVCSLELSLHNHTVAYFFKSLHTQCRKINQLTKSDDSKNLVRKLFKKESLSFKMKKNIEKKKKKVNVTCFPLRFFETQ